MSVIARVTKEGYDVNTLGLEPRRYRMHEAYPLLKVFMQGGGETTGSTLTITHNLGYQPLFLFYLEYLGSGKLTLCTGDTSSGLASIVNDTSDPNKIYISGIPSSAFDYYYYIFYD